MATKREKRTVIAGVTREKADEAFAAYAKSKAESEKIKAEIDRRCAEIREKYALRLSTLEADRDLNFNILQAYASENPDLFLKKKSLEMAHGVIGFRTGMPKLKTVKRLTWGAALTLVKRILPGYVRTSEEINKEALLADRDSEELIRVQTESGNGEEAITMTEAMKLCGIEVVQDESFYVECKEG